MSGCLARAGRPCGELARLLAGGELALDGGADRAEVQRRLLEIPGVGPWTATYISLRALGDPDAFPAGDLGLRRAAERLGLPEAAARLEAALGALAPVARVCGALPLGGGRLSVLVAPNEKSSRDH